GSPPSTGTPGCASCAAAGGHSTCRGRADGARRFSHHRDGDRADRQRRPGSPEGRAPGAALGLPARAARADRRQAQLRRAGLRQLHGARRRRLCQRLHLPGGRGARARGADDRGLRPDRRVRGVRGGLRRPRRAAVRLLHPGPAADAEEPARRRRAADRGGHPPRTGRQHLPLHGLPLDPRGGTRAGRDRRMTVEAQLATLAEVGVSRPRKDAHEKLSGQAQYVGDMEMAGMLHGSVLRSPFAHANIRSIDVSAALEMEGVAAILTAADLDDIEPYYGHAIKDRPIVAIDRVRFAGEPVAAVAAVDEATAQAAVRAIEVSYEQLPVLGTLEQALAPDAPRLHERVPKIGLFHGLGDLGEQQGNVCYRHLIESGDVEAARAQAAFTVEGTYTFPAVYQYAMETHATIAHYHGDGVTLWANGQPPFLVQAEIADLFGLPIGSVRIVVGYLGGGFGSKSYTQLEPLTVALARKAGRPVRIVNRVEESMVTSRRHGMRAWMRTTAAADGELLTREVRFWMDTGAYADNGPRVTATGADAAAGPYRFAAVSVQANCVYCNTPPSGSYRAFGATHLQWIGESQLEALARQAGVDPLDLRRRCLVLPGEPVRPDGSGKPLDADLVGDVERVAEAVGWGEQRRPWVGRGG